MVRAFQRALLLSVSKYSLYNSLLDILNELSEETRGYDIREEINAFNMKIQTQLYRFPYKLRNKWENRFLSKINENIINNFNSYDPDLVMIYNSEYLFPETCSEIRKKAKLIFFMGDSPFYTPVNNYYLTCLTHADLILSPDTFWNHQLNTMGLHKTAFFVPGLDKSSYYILPESELADTNLEEFDLLYTGSCYVNSWGFKKALLMNQFTGFNFRLYGNNSWERWFRFFPQLESHFKETGYIPTDLLNKMYNKTKLIPVDGNPGILNGFHLRLFEAVGAGVLPLVEYRKDVDELLFGKTGLMVPIIKDYNKAGDVARYYINNENERLELAGALRSFFSSYYSARRNSERIIELLNKYLDH